jgi:nucleoside-diphosphate-sugar epimerase
MSRPRILITGATGFIARALVPRLLEDAEVTLLLLEEFGSGIPLPSPLNRLRPQLNMVYADLRNYQLTARALRQARPDKVVHLAAVGVSDPFLSVNTALSHNVTGTLNLLRACFESDGLDVSQVIVARTPGERTAMNVYAASKAAAWSFCKMYARTAHWPIQGAMIFQAYGPHQPSHLLVPAALQAALAGEDFPMTSGEQEKDWIYIDDIVGGFQALLNSDLPPGTTVELGSGRATRVIDVVEEIFRIVDRGGRPIFGAIPNRPGEDPRQIAEAERTATLINWRAELSLSDALRRLVKSAKS